MPLDKPIPKKECNHIGETGKVLLVAVSGHILVDFDGYDPDEHWYLPEHLALDTTMDTK